MSTHNIPFSIKTKQQQKKKQKQKTLNHLKSAAKGFFSLGLKNEFETAIVKEPSVFEPLKFYCNM